jgi:chemotaxis protein histidine kinase CheA/chemotaxis protein CheY-P-specific phosphatase CheC
MEVKAEYRTLFCEEAADQLREWEESLLALEKSPGEGEQVNRMFRAIHTMKGSAGFIGYDGLQKVAHDLESSLQQVREGSGSFDPGTSSLLFEGLDICRAMIDAFTDGREVSVDAADFLARLAAVQAVRPSTAETPADGGERGVDSPVSGSTSSVPVGGPLGTCRLSIRIDGEPREAYLRSFLVKNRLERLGRILAVDPSVDSLKDSSGPFVYGVTLETAAIPASIPASLSVDQVSVSLEAAAEPTNAPDSSPSSSGVVGKGPRAEEVVRVSVKKLDTLLNLVGELVIQSSGFVAITQQLRQEYGKAPFIYDLEQKTEGLSAITRELQAGIMRARMLPVANVFNRFHRVVRDLSKASGKSVALEVFGEDTEIDKKVIDRIGEPLVHLVRNAVDHGIECPEERGASGKSPQGRVRLGAYQEGDHICIEVSDDGRGLDREVILKKAIQKALIGSEEALTASAERILDFIFLPGFSTAERVSDISGRGVGMDAVRSAVEEMNGSLRVRSSPHAGTAVTITLPLTMAIISAVLVEGADSTFAIPLSSVREILKIHADALSSVGGQRVILLRQEVLALINLATSLQRGKDADSDALSEGMPVVVVDFEGRKIGLEVQKILGTREVVIKSLSRHYREIDGLIGASILGNGKIALIVDVETLIRQHYHGANTNGRNGKKGIVEVEAHEDASAEPAQAVDPQPAKTVLQAPAAAAPAPAPSPAGEPSAAPGENSGAEQNIGELARQVINSQGTPLEEVNNTSAIQASIFLSQFTGREVRVSFPESRLIRVAEVADAMGGEETAVGGLYVEVKGDLAGGILLVLPFANLLEMDDFVHGRPAGTARDLSSVDLSALCEIGNILSACFINTMADSTRLRVIPGVPEISIDMCLPVIDSVLARFNQPGDEILTTEAILYGSERENIVCHLMLFLEPSSLEKLIGALTTGAATGMAG